jgi:hypothetical protein
MNIRYYYAIVWPYGQGALWQHHDGKSLPCFDTVRFTSKAARDAWAADGEPYKNASMYREAATRAFVMPKLRKSARVHGCNKAQWCFGHTGPESLLY